MPFRYVSDSLSPVKLCNLQQPETEIDALVFAGKCPKTYFSGREFDLRVVTARKPLQMISGPRSKSYAGLKR